MYHRMFLGFAMFDIIDNLTYFTGTWAMPQDLEGRFMNVGTGLTCRIQAFFSILGYGTYMYLSTLCICCYLAVRNDFQEIRYRRFEKIAHVVCFLIPIIFSLASILLQQDGPDATRCWFQHPNNFCADLETALANQGKCNIDTLTPTWTYTVSTLFYVSAIPFTSTLVAISALIAAVVNENRKRKRNQSSQGKVLFMETACKKKSRQLIHITVGHLLVTLIASCLFRSSRFHEINLHHKCGFAFVLVGIVAMTLRGSFHVLIFLSINRAQIEDNFSELLERHSLRKSIRSVLNVPFVTQGYKPKCGSMTSCVTKSISANTTDFGIFIGGDEDEELLFNSNVSPNVSFKRQLSDNRSGCQSIIEDTSKTSTKTDKDDVIHEVDNEES